MAERAPAEELLHLVDWAATTETGDRAELDVEPSERAWSAVSVSRPGVPGRGPLPERRRRASPRRPASAPRRPTSSSSTSTSTGSTWPWTGVLLPEHELAIIDEAHQLEDIVSATSGIELTGGRFIDLARRTRGVIADDRLPAGVDDAGRLLTEALRPHRDRRLRGGLPDDLAGAITVARGRVEQVLAAGPQRARSTPPRTPARGPCGSCSRPARSLDDLGGVERVSDDQVVWVEGTDANPVLRVAPLDVSGLLKERLWDKRTAVLTSATLPPGCPPASACRRRRSPSSMSAARSTTRRTRSSTAPPTSPTRGNPGYVEALTDELGDLIEAAGGRTLALFTSFRVLDEAAAALQLRFGEDLPILTQRDLPKARLLEQFTADEATSLFATMGFWQGVDVPGRSLSLVAIDRIPFPRPDEPLLEARRERAGSAGLRPHRPPPRRHPPRPGRRSPHPHGHRPRRRRRPRPPPRQGRLPLGPRQRPPADAPHQGPRRGPPHPRGDPRPAPIRPSGSDPSESG